ncbi:hypothetical protein N9W84_00045 [bacterium]|nr:hypothetical protein [bacterium]
MTTFAKILNINSFSVKDIDLSAIKELEDMLPKHKIMDKNIANKVLDVTLEGVNICNERIPVIDRWLGELESKKNKAWSQAALVKAKAEGYKTAKDKEWFASEDDDYISVMNEINLAKAAKKWLENKASYFSMYHYRCRAFIKSDSSAENSSTHGIYGYNNDVQDGTSEVNWTK